MQPVMMATDGSEGADRAVQAAAKWAKITDEELVIVHVESGDLDQDLEQLRRSEHTTRDEILYALSAEILAHAQTIADSMGLTKIRTRYGVDDVVGFILDVAKRERPDVIVVGKRGRGRVAGLLIGSVSQKLLCLSPCKVLVVP